MSRNNLKLYEITVINAVETPHMVSMVLSDERAAELGAVAVENFQRVGSERYLPEDVATATDMHTADTGLSVVSQWIDNIVVVQKESVTARDLGPDEMTLDHAGSGDPEGLVRWDANRWIVPFVRRPVLEECWENYPLVDGRVAAVRRTDCGAGCRCAGEFVILP